MMDEGYHRAGMVRAVRANQGWMIEFILDEDAALVGVINRLTEAGIKIERLDKHQPTLEDVFVKLVGRSMDEVEREDEHAA